MKREAGLLGVGVARAGLKLNVGVDVGERHAQRIGLVDERPALDPHLPLGKALAFWGRIDGPGDERLGALGLETLLDVPVRYLSTEIGRAHV